MATWGSNSLGSLAEMVSQKIPVSQVTIDNYISTENMLPDKKGVRKAAKLPPSGNVNSFQKGDVLFSNIRTYFKKVWLADFDGGASSDVIIFRPLDKNVITCGFLYYVLSSDAFIDSTVIASKGTKMPRGDKDAMRSYMISLPPLTVQKKIVTIISAYDKLIENNNRRINIAHEITELLYEEWFVNFRFPGYEKEKFVDTEIGLIPDGWTQPFQEYVDFKEGPGLRRWQYRDSGIPFLNIRTLVKHDINLDKCQYLDPEEVEDRYQHFLLQPYDHVVSSSGTIGRIVTVQEFHLPLMLNTSIIRMRAKKLNVGLWQLKHFLQSDYYQNQIHSFATGAAQKNYGPSHLKEMHIIAPPQFIGEKYELLVAPFEQLICVLIQKNRNLRGIRDFLVPKLLSSEIRVEGLKI